MGLKVIAKCKCGVETSILNGGGMLNFKTTCLFPCICENCHAVVQVNLLAKRKQCPKCKSTKVISYDDPTLSGRAGKCTVTSWNMQVQLGRELKLTNGNYRCPQCGQMTLRFADSGLLWD